MTDTAVDQQLDEAELRAWDWAAELRASGRPYTWLARQTDRAAQTVYQYKSGQTRPSLAWLREAWALLRAS